MKPHAFLSLENTFSSVLSTGWRARAQTHAQLIADQLEAGSYTGAAAAASSVSLDGLVTTNLPRLSAVAKACILFGASGLAAPRETGFYTGALDMQDAVDGAMRHLQTIVEVEGSKAASWEALQQVQGRQYRDEQPVALYKAETIGELADKLNAATMGTGKALIDIGANQTTSRLIAFGFLSQAQHQKVDTYQISEVLDGKTCPVCRFMHGKTFKVVSELATLKQALQAQDVSDLKSIKPWPKQSKAGLASLYTSSAAKLQNDGYGSPPYHPNCRGMLVPIGSVEEEITSQEGYDPEKLKSLFDTAKKKPTGASVIERDAFADPPPYVPPTHNPPPFKETDLPPQDAPAELALPDLIDKLPNLGLVLVAKSLLAAGQMAALDALLKKYHLR